MDKADRASLAARQWASERPDLDASLMALSGRLTEAATRIGREHIEPFCRAHGLQPGEFDVLATLRRSGPPFALTPTALYGATMVTSGAMTGRIDRLERAGLVAREPDPADRRSLCVRLTGEGFALIDRLMADHVKNLARAFGALSPAERDTLARLLGRLIAGLPPPFDAASGPTR